jgi:hypothetical protein
MSDWANTFQINPITTVGGGNIIITNSLSEVDLSTDDQEISTQEEKGGVIDKKERNKTTKTANTFLISHVCGHHSDHNSKKRICNGLTRSLWYVEIVVCRMYHTSSFRETSFWSAKVAGTEFLPHRLNRSSGAAHKMGSKHGFHSDCQ